MPEQLVVVISGVGRGIGNALARSYLSRPNCTVVGSVRNGNTPGVAALKTVAADIGSKFLIVEIESASETDAKDAVQQMRAAGIDHIDILIANAGVSPPIVGLETVDLASIESAVRVNALGPLALYQACHELLMKSSNPKFVSMSSKASSISGMSAHCGNDSLIAVAVSPGLVDSDMGNKTAREHMGLTKAPITMEDSAERITKLVEEATRDNASGKLIGATDGETIPW
ncbi:NAD(P)-binding protein [Apiospora arundinis]